MKHKGKIKCSEEEKTSNNNNHNGFLAQQSQWMNVNRSNFEYWIRNRESKM